MPTSRLQSLAANVQTTTDDVGALLRLLRDLPRFVSAPLSLDQARERVEHRLPTRAARLLATVERAIYRNPRSPYFRLLLHAGCELGDFRALIQREGIEGGLSILARQGVYVTFDELKGRREAVRGSARFSFAQREFDNPLTPPHVVLQTSGSGGRPSRVRYPLAYIDEWAADMAVVFDAHGLERPSHAFWWPVPIIWFTICARIGQPLLGWFYPVHPLPSVVSVVARMLARRVRAAGVSFPLPRRCDLTAPETITRWLVDRLGAGRPIVVWSTPSAGTRVGIAATAAGLDLTGLTLMVGGEPVTAARREQMEASGARVIVMYSSVEAAGLTYSCATPDAVDDVHVMLDRFAVVQRPRPASEGGPIVDALLVTSITPNVAKITLNAELGDYAVIEERACACRLGALGLRTHLSEMRSFEKLTGEGVTFARSNLMEIMEEELPARFGGTGLDYQLAEEEASDGRTRLSLRVSPSVGPLDEDELRAALLDALGRGSLAEKYSAELWRNANSLDIRRERPLATRAGKVLPFHLRARAESQGART